MVFCFTFLTYNGQRIFRLKKYTEIGERLLWVMKHRALLMFVSGVLGVIGIICLFLLHPPVWLLLFPMGLLSIFYVVPLPILNKGLRNIHYLKVFVISLVWSLIIVVLPFIESQDRFYTSARLTLAFTQCFIFILAITLPFDIRDIAFDKKENLKTIPQWIGVKPTIYLSMALIVFSLLIFYTIPLNRPVQLALVFAHIITLIIIGLTNTNRKELFYAGWIESTVLILWACVIIADLLYVP